MASGGGNADLDPREAARGGVKSPALPVARGRESPLLINIHREIDHG
jgi:hypothetical protein